MLRLRQLRLLPQWRDTAELVGRHEHGVLRAARRQDCRVFGEQALPGVLVQYFTFGTIR